jgi:ribosome-associated protein
MVYITPTISISESELSWTFVRSGGPGGQNVNKVASKAVLRWQMKENRSLPDQVRRRLETSQRRRITTTGEMIISSQLYRDQERNRQDCLDKLRRAVLKALEAPRPRKATRPTRGSRQARLRAKRHRSERKSMRRKPSEE